MAKGDASVILAGEPASRYRPAARRGAAPGVTRVKGVQFVFDGKGRRTGVFIDLVKNPDLWEDVFDVALIRRRAKEPRSSLAEVKKKLAKAEKLPAHGA
jgi:hypothetical protein